MLEEKTGVCASESCTHEGTCSKKKKRACVLAACALRNFLEKCACACVCLAFSCESPFIHGLVVEVCASK